MFETVVRAFVLALTAYAGFGLLFAVAFVSAGVQRLDTQARGAGVGFRLLILPGVAAFWPLFLGRWIRGLQEPPAENNPHRGAAAS
jgi:hypothetical protein